MTFKVNAKNLLISLVIAIFGGFYSAIADLAALLPYKPINDTSRLALRIGVSVGILIFSFGISLLVLTFRARNHLLARLFGFEDIQPRWFSSEVPQRIASGRRYFEDILNGETKLIRLASVSAEWDITKAIPEKELRTLARKHSFEIRILISHPESEGLRHRCELEPDLDYITMKRRIISNTKYLSSLSPDVKITVRWYLTSPKFHILASERIMHFSPFVDGIPGHDTQRYKMNSENPLYISMMKWFDEEWERAIDPLHEINWAERQLSYRGAVFLDRDNTLIKDLAYTGDPDNALIEILPGVIDGLRQLSIARYRLIVVSNQEPVGLGIVTRTDLNKLTQRIKNKFRAQNLHFDAFYYCTHTVATECNCRKPHVQLFQRASSDFGLQLSNCYFIGDSDADEGVIAELPELKVFRIGDNLTFTQSVEFILSDHTD